MSQSYSDPARFADLLQELTARSIADQVRTTQRYRDLLQRIAAGEVDAAALRVEHDRLVAANQAELARDLSTLLVRYYEAILDLNRNYVDRLFEQLGQVAQARSPNGEPDAATAQAPTPEPAPLAVELVLTGFPGGVAESGFVIENKREEPAEIVFLVSDFTSPDGEPFRPELEIAPPRFQLPPQSEGRVALRLHLDPEHFESGRRYRGEVLVRGGEELELQIAVDVQDATEQATP
jgi:hypothetical protein